MKFVIYCICSGIMGGKFDWKKIIQLFDVVAWSVLSYEIGKYGNEAKTRKSISSQNDYSLDKKINELRKIRKLR